MKRSYKFLGAIVLLSFLAAGGGEAQILNPGFESWSGGNPVNWITGNAAPSIVSITQSADAHGGSSAVKGTVVSFSGFAIAPFITSGSDGRGSAVNTQQPAVHGWYKFTPVGGDIVYASATMVKGGNSVGAGLISSPDVQSVYTEFVVDITYFDATVPDTCIISASITSTGGTVNVGSTFYLDDVSFGLSTAADEHGKVLPGEFGLLQNYPNPFNPVTLIQYALPSEQHVRLTVFDVLGRECARLVDQKQPAGSYRAEFNAVNLPSGIYYYRLEAGKFVSVKKMMIVK